jgi:hypothetical protein
MPSTPTLTRRGLIKRLALAAGTATMLPALGVEAADPAHLNVKDPAALAHGYVEQATQVDLKKFPSYEKGSSCENCALLQGAAGAAYRPCTLFPGKRVSAAGWCSAWAPEI